MSAKLAGIPAQLHRSQVDYLHALHARPTALVLTLRQANASALEAVNAASQRSNRRTLWPLGISGDRPLLLLHAQDPKGVARLCAPALVLRGWSRAGVACDRVVLSHRPHACQLPLQRGLTPLRQPHAIALRAHFGPAVTSLHLLRTDLLLPQQIRTLHSLARVQLQADGQALPHQVRAWCNRQETPLPRRRSGLFQPHDRLRLRLRQTVLAPATGAFTRDGGALTFTFDVGAGHTPQRPWCNILANPGFGTLVSGSSAGYTWPHNSRMNQLSAWANDPVSGPTAERFLLPNRRTRLVWNATQPAWGSAAVAHQVVHSQGITTFGPQRMLAVSVSSRCAPAPAESRCFCSAMRTTPRPRARRHTIPGRSPPPSARALPKRHGTRCLAPPNPS
jgi:cyclic beta-1,2-glucan synthetase